MTSNNTQLIRTNSFVVQVSWNFQNYFRYNRQKILTQNEDWDCWEDDAENILWENWSGLIATAFSAQRNIWFWLHSASLGKFLSLFSKCFWSTPSLHLIGKSLDIMFLDFFYHIFWTNLKKKSNLLYICLYIHFTRASLWWIKNHRIKFFLSPP